VLAPFDRCFFLVVPFDFRSGPFGDDGDFLVFESDTGQTLFNLCDEMLQVPDAPPASWEMNGPSICPPPPAGATSFYRSPVSVRERADDIGTLDSGIYGPRTLDRESYVPSLQKGWHCRAFDGG
jgi:hypothetical protein